MSEKTTTDLTQALDCRDFQTVRDLVEQNFERVARDEYEWFHELIDAGYSRSDIVELLLEETNDAPWIYCVEKDQQPKNVQLSAEGPEDPENIQLLDSPWIKGKATQHEPKHLVTQNLDFQSATSKDPKNISFFGTPWMSNHEPKKLETQNSQNSMKKSKNPKNIPSYNPPWMSKRHDIKKLVQKLCGLGGIAPTSRSKLDWNGEVIFEDDYSTSYITYSISSKNEQFDIISRLRRVMKSICEAVAALQSAGLCLNKFTIIHIPVKANTSTCDVQVASVNVAMATRLYNVLNGLSPNFQYLNLYLRQLEEIAEQILDPLITPSIKGLIFDLELDDAIQFCCLAAQFLCIGLVSFCQGHVGPIESVLTNHSQERSVLLGSGSLNSPGGILYPYIAVRLTKLTCLSEMTEGPLITFSLIAERPEKGERSQGSSREALPHINATGIPRLHVDEIFADDSPYLRTKGKKLQGVAREALSDKNATGISRLGLEGIFADERLYNVEAMPQDILDTWGPGELVRFGGKDPWIKAIHVGGGVIYHQHNFGQRLHWAAGSGPKDTPGRFFRYDKRITIGAPVTENLTQCSFPWKKWRASCPLVHLAVRPEKWAVNERQLGLQVGPDHAALQAIQVWNKVPGKLLKEYQLSQGDLGMMEFLGCYVGVQMSCCTGVARRIPLNELLSDLVPKFCTTHMGKRDWEDWNTQYNVVAGLRRSDAHEWLCALRRDSADAYTILLGHVYRILSVLEPTGLNRERTQMKLAWPKEGDLHRGIKIPCQDKHLWAQALVDSEEGATFAYMTSTCLLCEGNSCQQLQNSWRMVPKCIGTAVTQYRDEVEQDDASASGAVTTPTAWTLQNGQSYHMWNEKRCIRMKADLSSHQQYRLTASESTIPSHYAKRFFRGRQFKRNLLREKHHPDDMAVDVLILDRD